MPGPNRRTRALVAAATAAFSTPAMGAVYTWVSAAGGSWSTPANWQSGAVPVSNTDTAIVFNGAGTLSYTATDDLANPLTLRALILHGTSKGTRTLKGSRLQLVNGAFFQGLFVDSADGWQIDNDLELATDVYLAADTGTNATTLAGAFSGPGRALLYGNVNRSLVVNGAGHSHAGTEIVAFGVALGPAATFGPKPVSVTGSYNQQTAWLLVPSATNIASGDGSLRAGAGSFVEFGSLANNAVQRFSADSEGVLAIRADTVQPATINMATAPRLPIGVSSTNAAQVVTLTAQVTPAANTYRFGGNSRVILAAASLSSAGSASNVLPILNIASPLTDGPAAAPRAVVLGGTYANQGYAHGQGKVRLSNPSNSYTGGTLVERNPGNNDPVYLVFDYAPAPGQTPLGTGPLKVQGGLIFEGNAGSLGALPNAIEFQPGSLLAFNNMSGTNQVTTVNVDRWPDARAIDLNGTDLQLRTFGDWQEKVGPLSFAGGSSITFTYSASGISTVHADALARAAAGRGTLTIRAASGKTTDTNQLQADSMAAGMVDAVTGMVHPSVVFDNRLSSTFLQNTTFLQVDAAGVLRSYPFAAFDNNSDHEVATAGSSISADQTVWALQAYSLNLGGKALTVRSGGLILFGGSIDNGSLNFANNAQPVEALIYVRNNQGAPITASITAAGITKSGPGSITLSAPAAWSGPLTINGGSVIMNAPGSVPDGTPVRIEYGAFLGLNAYPLTVSSLTGAGALSGGTATTTLTVDNATDQEYSGRLTDDANRGRLLNLTKTGAGTLTLSGINAFTGVSSLTGFVNPNGGYGGLTSVNQGTLVCAERFLRYGSYQTAAGASLVFKTDHAIGTLDGAGATTVAPGATLTAAHIRQALLNVQSGATARVTPGGGDDGVSSVNALTVAADATLDLTNNALTVDYDNSTPAASIRGLLKTGFNNGIWTGKGIVSSTAAATGGLALGYTEASTLLGLNPGDTTTWMGRTVDATTLLVRLTRRGDANLDGVVNFPDLVAVAQHYDTLDGSAVWYGGDFNYDGKVDFQDLVTIAQNYDAAFPAGPTPGSPTFDADLARALATVPEPTTTTAALFTLALTATRRRRHPSHAP